MAMRPVTTAPVPVGVSRPDPARADPTPLKAAGRRRVVLIGALSGALILVGGGFAAALLMKGPAQTGFSPTALATAQTSQSPPVTTPVVTPVTTQAPIPVPDPEVEALAALNQQRAADLPTTPLEGQWVAQLSSKYDGIVDPLQTSGSGSHTFHYVDILAEFQRMQALDLGGASLTLLLSTDYGQKETVSGHALWVTFAMPALSSADEVQAWCSRYFAPLTGPELQDTCTPRQLAPS